MGQRANNQSSQAPVLGMAEALRWQRRRQRSLQPRCPLLPQPLPVAPAHPYSCSCSHSLRLGRGLRLRRRLHLPRRQTPQQQGPDCPPTTTPATAGQTRPKQSASSSLALASNASRRARARQATPAHTAHAPSTVLTRTCPYSVAAPTP
jgi:hypothetical protein